MAASDTADGVRAIMRRNGRDCTDWLRGAVDEIRVANGADVPLLGGMTARSVKVGPTFTQAFFPDAELLHPFLEELGMAPLADKPGCLCFGSGSLRIQLKRPVLEALGVEEAAVYEPPGEAAADGVPPPSGSASASAPATAPPQSAAPGVGGASGGPYSAPPSAANPAAGQEGGGGSSILDIDEDDDDSGSDSGSRAALLGAAGAGSGADASGESGRPPPGGPCIWNWCAFCHIDVFMTEAQFADHVAEHKSDTGVSSGAAAEARKNREAGNKYREAMKLAGQVGRRGGRGGKRGHTRALRHAGAAAGATGEASPRREITSITSTPPTTADEAVRKVLDAAKRVKFNPSAVRFRKADRAQVHTILLFASTEWPSADDARHRRQQLLRLVRRRVDHHGASDSQANDAASILSHCGDMSHFA